MGVVGDGLAPRKSRQSHKTVLLGKLGSQVREMDRMGEGGTELPTADLRHV